MYDFEATWPYSCDMEGIVFKHVKVHFQFSSTVYLLQNKTHEYISLKTFNLSKSKNSWDSNLILEMNPKDANGHGI